MKNRVVIVTDDIDAYKELSFQSAQIVYSPFNGSVDLLLENNAELVVLDCDSDCIKGISTLKKLKMAHPGVPVIFLTSASSESIVIGAFKAGAREYCKKPVKTPELQEMIENLLTLKMSVHEKRAPMLQAQGSDTGISLTFKPAFQRTLRYIEDNLSRKISLCDLARESNLSKYHFCRAFTRYLGLTPMSYVTSKRVERAMELLMNRDMTVSMVAFEVGFENSGSLIRHFKKSTGFTPARYREHIRRILKEE